MSAEDRICSGCKWPLAPDDAHCPGCGQAVSSAETLVSPPERTDRLEAPKTETEQSVSFCSRLTIDPLREQPLPRPVSECPDLDIYYDASRFFVEGMVMPFTFRITPRGDGVSALALEINTQSGVNERKQLQQVLRGGLERTVAVDVRIHDGSGMMTFDVAVSYRKDGAPRRFMVSRTHEVHPRHEARKLFENFRIEINQGHAGDINQNFQGLEKLMQKEDWGQVFSELKIPARWEPLALEECQDCGGECIDRLPTPPEAARQTRLTLTAAGFRIHLLSGDRIQMGRDRACDLVTRLIDLSGCMPKEANLTISRRHAGLVHANGQVCVVRGDLTGLSESSGSKLYLNGLPVDNQEPLPDEFVLTLAHPQSGTGVFGLKGRKVNTPDGPAGVILLRTDAVREIFVVIYSRVKLGFADARFGDLCVCRQKNGFALSGSPGICAWLQPGASHNTSIGSVKVQAFSQEGL